ncbi:hypothetical protein ACF0H5_023529 [Mactra antiquata]
MTSIFSHDEEHCTPFNSQQQTKAHPPSGTLPLRWGRPIKKVNSYFSSNFPKVKSTQSYSKTVSSCLGTVILKRVETHIKHSTDQLRDNLRDMEDMFGDLMPF